MRLWNVGECSTEDVRGRRLHLFAMNDPSVHAVDVNVHLSEFVHVVEAL